METLFTVQQGLGRAFRNWAFLLVGLFVPLLGQAAGNGLVISQVYGGGGQAGSTYAKDFIELFNNSSTAFIIPASSYSVQYADFNGTSWSVTGIPAVTIAPYGYYLIQLGPTTSNGGASLPTADLVTSGAGAINMGAGAGKIALVTGTTALSGQLNSPNSNPRVIDFVGYGTADAYEGTKAATKPNATNSITRQASGPVDTDQNDIDFLTQVANPHNSDTPTVAVTTTAASQVLPASATVGGTVALGGGSATAASAVTERGIAYSTTARPRISGAGVTKVADAPIVGDGTGSYSVSLTGLTPNTAYYAVAYATTSGGTSYYGSDVTFKTLAAVTFYNKAGANLDQLASFGTNPDGSGTPPVSFTAAGQLFSINGATCTIASTWTVSGTNSKVMLQSGACLTVPSSCNFSGPLDLLGSAKLVQQNATHAITFGTIDPASTVEFAQTSNFINVPVAPGPGYGNLTLRNTSTTLLSAGTTTVRGNLLVNSAVFGGATGTAAAPSPSLISLGGNLTLSGTVAFTAGNDRVSLTTTGTTQTLDGGGNTIKLYKLTVANGQTSLADNTSNVELGTTAIGGGYALADGTILAVNGNTLSFVAGGKSAILAGQGHLALTSNSNLIFSKAGNNSGDIGTLRLTPTSTVMNNLTVDLSGSGGTGNNTLALPLSLTVNGTLALTKGLLGIVTTTSNNYLTINGPVTSAGGKVLVADYSDLFIGGTGDLTPLKLASASAVPQLRNLTLDRANQTFTPGIDLRLNGTLTLTNGTFDISTGTRTLTLNGPVARTNGTLQVDVTSTLSVVGSGPLGTLAFSTIAASPTLGNLSLTRPFGTLSIVALNPSVGVSLQVNNTTLTSGTLSLGTKVTLIINGPLVVPNPSVAKFAVTTTSGLSLRGTGDIGPLAFVDGQNQLQDLTVNHSNTVPIPTIQLMSNLTVKTLTLTYGRLFVQGAYKLAVLPGGGVAGGNVNSYVNTLTQAAVTNLETRTATLIFHLGVNGQYRPLTFFVSDVSPGGTTSYTAHQYEMAPPMRALPSTLLRVSQIRYYNVVREAGGTGPLQTASIKLSYDVANDRVTTSSTNKLRIAMTDPADNARWVNVGGIASGNATSGTITSSVAFDAFPLGDFVLATDITTPFTSNPLPVELTRFEAVRRAGGVALTWVTASEKNSAHFEVERSLDGKAFATVQRVAAQGTTSQPTAYAALDAQAPASALYYRLRQVDLDGTAAFSPVVTVAGTGTPGELVLYPNPATDHLVATLPAADGRTYRVLNTLGQVLAQGSAATANPVVDVRALPAGAYFLELRSATDHAVRRFVKND